MDGFPPPTRFLSLNLGLPGPMGRGHSFHVLWGPPGISGWALEALCPLLEGPARVYWVDAVNRFDAHGLAKAARALGMDPRGVLGRVEVARPFNAFQLAAIVTGKLPRLPRSPVILAEPLALFYDDEFPLEDARRVFERFRLGLADVPGPVVALLVDREAPTGRREFASRLTAVAANVLRLPLGNV